MSRIDEIRLDDLMAELGPVPPSMYTTVGLRGEDWVELLRLARLGLQHEAEISQPPLLRQIDAYQLALLKECEEALEFYGDHDEWIDFKAFGVSPRTGKTERVDSHFDDDNGGARARTLLAKLRGESGRGMA